MPPEQQGADAGADTTPKPGGAPPAAASPPAGAEADANLFDAVGEGEGSQAGNQAAGADGRPDGLPDQFWDPDKKSVRAPELAKSWLDLRRKVSRGEGTIPEKPEAYTLPEVEGGKDLVPADDPLWTTMRGAAHAAGVTQKQLEALAKPFLEFGLKARGEKQPADPAAEKAAVEAAAKAEMEKLGPNARVLVADMKNWIGGMEARGSLGKDEAAALRLLGNAAGIRALAKLRELTGEKPIPTDNLAAEGGTEADARRIMREGMQKGDQGMVEKARRMLAELEKRGELSVQAR
jgi:hypothetical protein